MIISEGKKQGKQCDVIGPESSYNLPILVITITTVMELQNVTMPWQSRAWCSSGGNDGETLTGMSVHA
jgi:hypothetical protein